MPPRDDLGTLCEAGRAMTLQDGARVGVIGGGPAGSLFAYFLLRFARLKSISLTVEVYEPRNFAEPGPRGCNMCGGIVSESLVRALAAEGIDLPTTVVQRGIDSYVLNTDEARVKIETPLGERRIAALHRGGGPRDLGELRWGGLDGYLLARAQALGAQVVASRVSDVGWEAGRPQVHRQGTSVPYDLLAVATGVNSASGQLLAKLGLRSRCAETTRAYITEVKLGYDAVSRLFGGSMYIFLLDIPRLEFAAIIPKGDFLTVCLLGHDVDQELIRAFFESPAVRRSLPVQNLREGVCHCRPNINVREVPCPFTDRVVLVGDCGVTRLYKDGIGAAYRTAKAAAHTAVFHGVSARDFLEHYWPVYRAITWDNRFGRAMFMLAGWLKISRLLRAGVLRTVAREQAGVRAERRMSVVLWDMFTGSASYRDILSLALDPRLVGRVVWESALAAGRELILKKVGGHERWPSGQGADRVK